MLHTVSKFGGKISKKIRYSLCKNIFKYCGKNVNIERLAWFGTGKDIEIGDNSGIGINAKVYNNVKIGKNVMMGPMSFIKNKWIKKVATRLQIKGDNKKGKALALNLMRCEAHYDMSKEILNLVLKQNE